MSRLKQRINKKKKFKKFKRLVLFSTFVPICFSIIIYNSKEHIKNSTSVVLSSQDIVSKNENNTLTLSFVGDIMVHNPQLKAQYDFSTNSYSFDNNFKYVKNYIEKSDLSMANLETTLAGSTIPYTSYPTFNTPDSIIDALKYSGIDILSTINNHSFDKGDLGVDRTLNISKEKGFETVGTVLDVDDNNYLIKNINNIKIGITSFSYGEIKNNKKYLNGIEISEKSKDKMNIFDKYNVDNAFNTINKTLNKLDDTDIQILFIHWGDEYQRNPNKFQIELAQKLANRGVDIIVGSHPHIVQPVNMIKSKDGKNETLVIYSLGNFLSNQRSELLGSKFTEDGLISEIEITKDFNNKTFISKANFIPTWVNKYNNGFKNIYEIIPIANKDELNSIENINLDKLKNSFINTTSQIETNNIIHIPNNPFE